MARHTLTAIIGEDIVQFNLGQVFRAKGKINLVIGRGQGADLDVFPLHLPIENKRAIRALSGVSKRHALIAQSGGNYQISDANSTNGTYVKPVSGPRIQLSPNEWYTLKEGDKIIFGRYGPFVYQVQDSTGGRE